VEPGRPDPDEPGDVREQMRGRHREAPPRAARRHDPMREERSPSAERGPGAQRTRARNARHAAPSEFVSSATPSGASRR
jgi:hypothetical protein